MRAPDHGPTAAPSSLRTRLLGRCNAWLLRLWWASWRRRSRGVQTLDDLLAAGTGFIAVFWHGQYLPLFTLLQGRSACVFTSDSRRGEVIAEICRHFGYHSCRLPEHDRQRALAEMRRALATQRAGAIAVDGPLGPRHQVKNGALRLAAELGFVLLPVAVAARRKVVLRRRWDHMEIPWPFSRIDLLVGSPLAIPGDLREKDLPALSELLRGILEDLERQAEEEVRRS